MCVHERRDTGRPKKIWWVEGVQKDSNLLSMTVAETGRLAQEDTEKWRTSMHNRAAV